METITLLHAQDAMAFSADTALVPFPSSEHMAICVALRSCGAETRKMGSRREPTLLPTQNENFKLDNSNRGELRAERRSARAIAPCDGGSRQSKNENCTGTASCLVARQVAL